MDQIKKNVEKQKNAALSRRFQKRDTALHLPTACNRKIQSAP
jgi:hypothetical protein